MRGFGGERQSVTKRKLIKRIMKEKEFKIIKADKAGNHKVGDKVILTLELEKVFRKLGLIK